ncbi:hypothetical protein ACHAXT_006563 [Thalassiosira profunda]
MRTTSIAARVLLVCSYCGACGSGFLLGKLLGPRYGAGGRQQGQSWRMDAEGSGAAPRAHSSEEGQQAETAVPVVCTGTVDYSAANEYIRAHYNQPRYFFDGDLSDGGSRREHEFYDGRALQSTYSDTRAMLDDNGLAIVDSSLSTQPDWSDVDDIRRNHLPELERLLPRLFPSAKLLGCSFWNPMVRGESYGISPREEGRTPTANVAALAHIDTDVGAYESIEEFLAVVEKNSVQSSTISDGATTPCEFDEVADRIIRGGKRFAIVNFWRNTGAAPVRSAPLAILSPRYDEPHLAFPDATPNMAESRWYLFPNATREEAIVFYQYDRRRGQPSDLWHCAVSAQHRDGDEQQQPPARTSFDVRALLVLDEVIPKELDRFGANRTRPALTLEESGCFCDEQAAIREGKESG